MLFASVSVFAVGSVPEVRFPVASLSTGSDPIASGETIPDTDYGKWVPPPASEVAVLDGMNDGMGKKIFHYSALGVSVGGTLLCAAGIATCFSGISGTMDSATMNRGAVMFISGSIVAAIFAAISNATATGSVSPE